MTTGVPALACRDLSVSYGDVKALAGVNATFEPGLIHAVVGQNGAGKTTFARAVSGLVKPVAGSVSVFGTELGTGKVQAARAAGVELVHQSFALPPSFTIAEVMEFGASGEGRFYTRKALDTKWQRHLTDLGITATPGQRVRDLPVETQQSVEIARALVTDARLLILDEPTAVLSPSGTERLFERVRCLKARGITVVLILHKIREVIAIADTVTVLRGGLLVAGPTSVTELTPKRIADLIIGSGGTGHDADRDAAVGLGKPLSATRTARTGNPVLLSLDGISCAAESDGPALHDISFDVRAGEILGIAGVEGNGQKTLVQVLSALAQSNGGNILLAGSNITQLPLAERRAAGLRVIPFERNSEGLSLSSSLWENWSVRLLLQQRSLTIINPRVLKAACNDALRRWDVRFSDTGQRAASLSGGNAQKVILAREIDEDARLIIAAQPTRGLDVGATEFVWQALRKARDRGCGIILISSDLDELFDISDRIAVLLSGRISGVFEPPYVLPAVGAAMTGVQQ
jgi:simple sugar transport system ATP-binding protein